MYIVYFIDGRKGYISVNYKAGAYADLWCTGPSDSYVIVPGTIDPRED